RFSDPGSVIETEYASSGLTPFIRRTTISTPQSKRRHTTPARLWNLSSNDPPISGTLQFEPLRQVLDGRVKRRLRRNRLSEEVNIIEGDKRQEARARRTEVERLRGELEAKDREIQIMRDEHDLASQIGGESGTSIHRNSSLSNKVRELEQQIIELKAELERKERDATEDMDWTMAARDPFELNDTEEDDDNMITNYSHDFRESMMDDEMMTTPARLRTSFPSPPSSMPNTPCKASSVHSAGIQTSSLMSDPEKELLRDQLDLLQAEIAHLTSSIALNSDNTSRLQAKLSDFMSKDEETDHTSLDSALDIVLTQLAMAQSHTLEKELAYTALSSDVTKLGFTSCAGPEEVLASIAAQFRRARLELEYMTPGEVVEGFENEKLLDMLVARMRVLVEKVKDSEDLVDEYHDQELLLRQQLNTRVDAMQDMQKELLQANSIVLELQGEIGQKDTSNARLQRALEGYREEVKGLETLISRMEKEGCEKEVVLRSEVDEAASRLQDEILKHETTRACEEGNRVLLMELERRLAAALQATAAVEAQLATLTSSHSIAIADKDAAIEQLTSSSSERERQHGEALALRDARVSALRVKLERVNDALSSAHKELEVQIEAMRDQLNRVLETGMGCINGDISVQQWRDGSCPAIIPTDSASRRYSRERSAPADLGQLNRPSRAHTPIVRKGGLLDGDMARRRSKKRRRYDN
ncbi:hypothetical protein B0O99DRAFT_639799, partial [Bisporella sp. PMI_857]